MFIEGKWYWMVMKALLGEDLGGVVAFFHKRLEAFKQRSLPIRPFALPVMDRFAREIKRCFVAEAIAQQGENLKQLVTQAAHDFYCCVLHLL